MSTPPAAAPGEVVLVHLDDKPAFHARIEALREHPRAGWLWCDLLVLGVPPQPATWILRPAQLAGEPFTMGGRPLRLEALPPPGAVHSAARAAGEQESGAPATGAVEATATSGAEAAAELSESPPTPPRGNKTPVPRGGGKVVDLTSRRTPRG